MICMIVYGKQRYQLFHPCRHFQVSPLIFPCEMYVSVFLRNFNKETSVHFLYTSQQVIQCNLTESTDVKEFLNSKK